LLRADCRLDPTIVHPNPVAGRPLRGSAATFLKDKGEQQCGKVRSYAEGWGLTYPRWCSTHEGGVHGARKEVLNAVFARCTAPLMPGARPAAVGALRQGLGVQLGRSVARQLKALMMVSTETPAWWAAALPHTPAYTAAGNPQW